MPVCVPELTRNSHACGTHVTRRTRKIHAGITHPTRKLHAKLIQILACPQKFSCVQQNPCPQQARVACPEQCDRALNNCTQVCIHVQNASAIQEQVYSTVLYVIIRREFTDSASRYAGSTVCLLLPWGVHGLHRQCISYTHKGQFLSCHAGRNYRLGPCVDLRRIVHQPKCRLVHSKCQQRVQARCDCNVSVTCNVFSSNNIKSNQAQAYFIIYLLLFSLCDAKMLLMAEISSFGISMNQKFAKTIKNGDQNGFDGALI